MFSFKSILQFATLVSATLALESHHPVDRRAPSTWHQARDHPVNDLFRRAALADVTFPAVGTDEWKKSFPTGTPDAGQMPKAWSDLLDAAVKDGKIPNIPRTTQKNGGDPTYPGGTDPKSREVCSSTYKCRTPDSIWDGPAGYFGISFDDGPLAFSDPLLDYLKKNGEKATHFMVGKHILENPNQFKKTFDQGHDIALHTYSHRPMTTLSNKDIVAELGWGIQIIHDSTGGFVPRFWRPPYADSDTRVEAIAREVFGLKTVLGNKDGNDWGIANGSQKKTNVEASFTEFLKSSKKNGLILLQNESSKQAIDVFLKSYPQIKRAGWKTKSLARLIGDKNPYQNVNGDEVTPDDRFLDHNGKPTGPAEEDTPDEGADDGEGDDDAENSDEDSSSTDDSDTSDEDSSSSDEGSSSTSASDAEPSNVDESDVDESDKKGKKDNGALGHYAGIMGGWLMILMCLAPGVAIILG